MKIIFMGTPDFSVGTLEALVEAGHEVVLAVTQPDKPKGRGKEMQFTPVKECALAHNIPVYQPKKIREPECIEELKKYQADVCVVVAFGQILPKEILEMTPYGCVNVHASLLPSYRGAAPIQWAVLNGDKKTGVTTMFMNAGMDTGDMILKEEVEIGDDETTGELWDRLKMIGANLLIKTVKEIENGTATRTKQPEEGTMAPMLSKEMAKIDWKNKTANDIKNLVRGLNPIMGAYTFLDGKKIKFWKVQTLTENELLEKFQELEEYKYHLNKMQAGTVLFSDEKKGLFIKANEGILQVLEIQGENSKKMAISDFLRGNKIDVGYILGTEEKLYN